MPNNLKAPPGRTGEAFECVQLGGERLEGSTTSGRSQSVRAQHLLAEVARHRELAAGLTARALAIQLSAKEAEQSAFGVRL